MFNSNGGYSLADIAAATGGSDSRNDGGWGDSGAWWIIILFLFVFCGWGNNGWGNGNGGSGSQAALTRGELCQDTGMLNGFSGVQQSVSECFHGVDNAICTLGYQQQLGVNTLQQAINGVAVGAMQNTNALQAQIQDCCCENRAQVADIKYTMATDTCAIQNAIQNSTRDMIDNQNANTRSILDFLVNDKISSLQSENQTLKFAASQQAQNAYLVDTLRPAPVPAFAVPAPYQYTNCGCGTSYGFSGGCAC